jgi:hypothetical protein
MRGGGMTSVQTRKIPYAGKEPRGLDAAMRRDGPIGVRGIALLRRVRAANGPYPCDRNADEEVAWRCVEAGFLVRDRRDDGVLHLTDAGRKKLDDIMRAV